MTRTGLASFFACGAMVAFILPRPTAGEPAVSIVGIAPYAVGANIGVRLTVHNAGNSASPAGTTLAYACLRPADGLVTTGNGIRTLPAIAAGATANVDDPNPSTWPTGAYKCALTADPLAKALASFSVPLSAAPGGAPGGSKLTVVNDALLQMVVSNVPLQLDVYATGVWGATNTVQIQGAIVVKGKGALPPAAAYQKIQFKIDGKYYGEATTEQGGSFLFEKPGDFSPAPGPHSLTALVLNNAQSLSAKTNFNL